MSSTRIRELYNEGGATYNNIRSNSVLAFGYSFFIMIILDVLVHFSICNKRFTANVTFVILLVGMNLFAVDYQLV